MENFYAIHPTITENTEDVFMKRRSGTKRAQT